MTQKVIWLVNKHAVPTKYNATHLRTNRLAYYFVKMGYDVRIISSGYVHNRSISLMSSEMYEEVEDEGCKFVYIRTIPYTSNGLKRIYSFYEFSRKLLKIRNKLPKPDIIIHTSNIPFDYYVYKCARKLKAKYIAEIVDLWPESFVAFGLVKKSNPILKLMYKIENYIYSKADNVVFSMEGGVDYIKDKKWDIGNGGNIDLSKVYYLNNGVDIDDFDYNNRNFRLEDCDLEDDSIKKIIYLGSIRLANNLKSLIDASVLLKDRSDVKVLIYGDGDDRSFLEEYCVERNINNVVFKQKWIELKYVPYVLSKADINIINYKPNSIEKYGGSQNKLFQSLASAKPICSNVGMGYSLINKFNLGYDNKFNSSKDYADALKSLLDLPSEEYDQMCIRARNTAEKFDLKLLAKKYSELLNNIL